MRRRFALLAAAPVALAVAAAGSVGMTYAQFSDFAEVEPNAVSAATVVVGIEDPDPPVLEFLDLTPESAQRKGELTVVNKGSLPADLTLALESDSGSTFCPADPQVLRVSLDGVAFDFCSVLDGDAEPILPAHVEPGGSRTVQITVDLLGADHRYSELDEAHAFVVRATQAEAGSFTDEARGDFRISTGEIHPPVPRECTDANPEFAAAEVIVLGPESATWNGATDGPKGRGPFVIVGTEGNDIITGTNKDDCVVGGGGKDVLRGENGQDVVVGGDAGDELFGGNGKDMLHGGDGDDTLNGDGGDASPAGNGADRLSGGPGNDKLYGGGGPDEHNGGDGTDDRCDGRPGEPDAETFTGCETIEPDPAAASLQQAQPQEAAVPVPAGGVREPAPSSVPAEPQTPPQPAAKSEPPPEQKPAPKAEPEPAKPEPQPEPDPKPKPDPITPPAGEKAPAADATPPVQPAT